MADTNDPKNKKQQQQDALDQFIAEEDKQGVNLDAEEREAADADASDEGAIAAGNLTYGDRFEREAESESKQGGASTEDLEQTERVRNRPSKFIEDVDSDDNAAAGRAQDSNETLSASDIQQQDLPREEANSEPEVNSNNRRAASPANSEAELDNGQPQANQATANENIEEGEPETLDGADDGSAEDVTESEESEDVRSESVV